MYEYRSASRMNTGFKYVVGLDLLNCQAEFCGDTISHFQENSKLLFLVIFYYFRIEIVTSALL